MAMRQNCVFLLVLLTVANYLLPPSVARAEDAEKFAAVLDGIVAHWKKLKTGSVTMEGTFVLGEHKDRTGTFQIRSSFDFPNEKWRFDRVDRIGDEQIDGGQFVRAADHWVEFPHYGEGISIVRPTEFIPGWVRGVDVRCLGMSGSADFMHSSDFSIIESAYRAKTHAIIQTTGDVLILEWIQIGPKTFAFQRKIWVDTTKDFSTVRHTISYGSLVNDKAEWKEPIEDHRITVEQRAGLWLPTGWTTRARDRDERGTIHWESINEPIDKARFEAHDFDLKRAAWIADARTAAPGEVIETKKLRP